MGRKIFSIVTVTLNCRDDAIKTVKSVLSQKFQDYEYIVKDGGSTDGTIEELRKLGVDVHVCADSGIYDAMNQALDLCSGLYVYFLNAGDVFYNETVLQKISVKIDHHVAVYYGDLQLMPINVYQKYPHSLSRYYLFRKNLNHQACFVKRDVYLEFGKFDLKYRFNADQHVLRTIVLDKTKKYKTHHLCLLVAIWQYGGYSTKKSNRSLLMDERDIMIKEFYPIYERLIYGIISMKFLIPIKNSIWDWRYKSLLK